MKKIVVYPAKILRQKAEEIKNVDKKLLGDIKKLVEIIEKGDNAAGLAANQIGIKKRFFGIKDVVAGLKPARTKPVCTVYINPEITQVCGEKEYFFMVETGFKPVSIEDEKKQMFLEGCLSLPSLYGTVKRYLRVSIKYQVLGIKNQLIEKEGLLEGYEAIVFQHELDHLNGVLFIDHVKEEGGKLYRQVGEKMIECEK